MATKMRSNPSPLPWRRLTSTFRPPLAVDGPGVRTCSIMDGFADFPSVPDDPGLPPRHEGPRHPGHPDHLAFTDIMLAQLDPSLHPLPRNMQQGIVVGTWYIHHEWHGRNEVPRMVRLPEDRTEWIFRLTAAWAGVIEPDTAMALSLPSPAPARTTHDQFVALDVIISQGLHIPRFSGLVTTHFIDDLDGNRHYTVAFSFPAQVSGHIIVDAAEVHHYCASPTDRACSIHHGWVEIPLDAEPRHRMRPGHAFVITVPNDPPIGVASGAGASDTGANVRSFGLPTGPAEEFHQPLPPMEEDDPDDVPPSPSTYMGVRIGDMFNCHIYRLRHPPLHIFLNHAAGVPMLQDLARRMGIVPTSLLQAHPVRAQMVGDRPNDWSFIIQSVTDLPAASSDALIILDVEVHFHPLPGQLPALPAAARRVCRVPRHLARERVLAYAGVAQYCRQQPDRCLVQLNGELWPQQSPAPRLMIHGNYLRVIVPPPLTTANTLQEIYLAERAAAATSSSQALAARPPVPAPDPSPAPLLNPDPMRVAAVALTTPPQSDAWQGTLQDSFDQHASTEFDEEGPVLHVWTWFINHETSPYCHKPQMVRLDVLAHLWLQDIYEPWLDQMQEAVPTTIKVVHPRPPAASTHMDTIHVMVEQHPFRGQSGRRSFGGVPWSS